MYNLFWGTSKNMIKFWLEKGFISAKDFDSVQGSVDNITVPSSIGCKPSKIASSFFEEFNYFIFFNGAL